MISVATVQNNVTLHDMHTHNRERRTAVEVDGGTERKTENKNQRAA